MKDALAERLLANVLGWGPEDMATERSLLQAMAAYKYDNYQQFSPGMRFIESLTRWLARFKTLDERRRAYEFAKNRLVYFSADEIRHLIEMAYPDHIRPFLVRKVAQEKGINPRHVSIVTQSPEFRLRQRQCLFLGLSDGARIADFRRSDRDLNNEQIWQTYELSVDRADELLAKLNADIPRLGVAGGLSDSRFRTVVLLDDFSASGTTYYRIKPDGTSAGKISTFHEALIDPDQTLSKIVDVEIDVIVLLYIATVAAKEYLGERLGHLNIPGRITYHIIVVQDLARDISLGVGLGDPIESLIGDYYDHDIFDEHIKKGGTADARYGYAQGGLPVVLHHNTPNNSISLLWSYDTMDVVGLFPRVQRHKEMP